MSGRKDGLMPFWRGLAWSEMRTTSSRSWTRVAGSISHDCNRFVKRVLSTYLCMYALHVYIKVCIKCIYIQLCITHMYCMYENMDTLYVCFPRTYYMYCHVVSHWKERNKKFPLPFCVWINKPQRLTVKRGN